MTKNRLKNGFGSKPGKKGLKVSKNVTVNKIVQTFVEPVKQETDAQIRAKLKDRFAAMDKMTEATVTGVNKSLIISGPAGLGKSYGVMKIAENYEKQGRKVIVIKGFVRATGLYKVLYENRAKNNVIIFDDSDSIFWDDGALGILKSACDMTRSRKINWLAETNMKDEFDEPLPTSFEFEGSVVFITNIDFFAVIDKGSKIAPHFEAMISRSIYLDLAMKSRRDYMMRITMVVEEGMLRDLGLDEFSANELLLFIDKNCENLLELSLRMVLKIAALMRMDRADWQRLARITCMRNIDNKLYSKKAA